MEPSSSAAPPEEEGASLTAGRRAARNTGLLLASEVAGRLAWFAVFAGLGRARGEAEVGEFVFAVAFGQIGVLALDLGLDAYLIRVIAKDRERRHSLTSDILSFKLALALPLTAAAVGIAAILGYGGETLATIFVLFVAFVVESLGRTIFSLLVAYESGTAIAVTAVSQRVIAAAIGLALLIAGFGTLAVAAAYLVGTLAGLALSAYLMVRTIGRLEWMPARGRWSSHARASLPFAAQDVFTVVLFKIDAVILALMTTQAAVGLYGAAYRVLEATLVVPYALVRAFAAMFVYLRQDTEPTIQGTFARSVKLALAALLPLSLVFGILAEPFLRSVFGGEFAGAAGPLRLLAPAVVMLGIVSLSNNLITSRRDPRVVTYLTAAIASLNVVLNVLLIPPYGASGAAASMLVSEILFSASALLIAVRTIGGLSWTQVLAGPLLAGGAMAVALLVLANTPAVAVAVGGVVYLGALYALERVISPADVRFAIELIRRAAPQGSAQ